MGEDKRIHQRLSYSGEEILGCHCGRLGYTVRTSTYESDNGKVVARENRNSRLPFCVGCQSEPKPPAQDDNNGLTGLPAAGSARGVGHQRRSRIQQILLPSSAGPAGPRMLPIARKAPERAEGGAHGPLDEARVCQDARARGVLR
ncbi:hypothetical protein B0H12DRAFT_81638 [Mycena haematopus]|nr:hypothetical protein B0H12DRAFT_81638 [Mycena haematopus]